MNRLRTLGTAFALAFVLALGQYTGLVHALGHATEQLTQKGGAPAKLACDQCFACSQLSGAAAVPLLAFAPPLQATRPLQADAPCAPRPARVVFRSRAPPVLS
jgi:hypothetical protein